MLEDLTFLHASHRPTCVASVDKRFDYHTLQLMARGGVELYYNELQHELHGSWMWACWPGPWVKFHEWPRNRPWDHRYVAFTGPLVARWEADQLWPWEPESLEARPLPELAARFDELIDLAIQPGRWQRLRAVNLLERVLLERAEMKLSRAPCRPAWLAAAMTQLASPTGESDYQRLARSLNMSLTTLRRRFRAETGQSMHQYRIECRIARARQLLGETDTAIKEISGRLGYHDVAYFTRCFTQICGVPPATYRRSRQR